MGERRRRVEAQRKKDSEIATDTKYLSSLELPDFALKYLGKEVFDGIKIMSAELAEFEPLITHDQVPIAEIVEYLGFIGFFDNYPKDIEHLASFLDKQHEKLFREFIKTNNKLKANEKIINSRVQISDAVNPAVRPLTSMVIRDLWVAADFLANEQMIELSKEDVFFKSLLERASETEYEEEELNIEKGLIRSTKTYSFVKELSSWVKKPDRHTDISGEIGNEDAPEELFDIKRIALEPGSYTLQLDIPSIENVIIQEKAGDPFLFGELVVNWASSSKFGKKYSVNFGVSNLTGDICVSDTHLVSLQHIFNFYGVGDKYIDFRGSIHMAIASGIADGSIKVRAIPEFAEKKDLASGLDAVIPVDKNELGDTPGIEFIEIEEDKKSVEPAETSLPGLSSIQEPAVNKRTGEKIGVLRNISYRDAVRAFGKLGFRVESGGRHHRLVSDDKKRSVVFMNPHSGATNDVSYIIKHTLRLLGIPYVDFAKALGAT